MGFYSLVAVRHKGKTRNSGLGQGFGFESWLHLLLSVCFGQFIIVLYTCKMGIIPFTWQGHYKE